MEVRRQLTATERTQFEAWIIPAVEAAGLKRCQNILRKETRLVEDGAGVNSVRVMLSTPSKIAHVIIDKLQDRPVQHRACIALGHIIRAAWKSDRVGEKAEHLLLQASSSFSARQPDRLSSLGVKLDELAQEDPDNPMLVDHAIYVRLESQSPEHVFAALEIVNPAPTGTSDAGDAEASSQAPRVDLPVDVQPIAAPSDTKAPPLSDRLVGSETSEGYPSAISATGLAGPNCADQAWCEEVDVYLNRLAEMEAAANTTEPGAEQFAAALVGWTDGLRESIAQQSTAVELGNLLATAQDELSEYLQQVLDTVGASMTSRLAASAALREAIGTGTLSAIRENWATVRPRIVASDSATIRGAWANSADLNAESRFAKISSAVDFAESESKKIREIQDLERRLAELKNGVAPGAPAKSAETAEFATGIVVADTLIGLRFMPGHELGKAFPRSDLLKRNLGKVGAADPHRMFLPVGETGATLASVNAAAHEQATAAAALLLDLLNQHVLGTVRASYLLDVLDDVATIASTPSEERIALAEATLGLLMVAVSGIRARKGGRHLRALLQSDSLGKAQQAFLNLLGQIVSEPGIPLVFARAETAGLRRELLAAANSAGASNPVTAKAFGEAYAIAVASLDDPLQTVEAILQAEQVDDYTISEIETYLDRFRTRKERTVGGLRAELKPWLAAFVDRHARCLYERGDRTSAVINVSVPKAVAEHGVFVAGGEDSVRLPFLIQNSGKSAAMGVEVVFTGKTVGASLESDRFVYVAWLSRADIEAPNDALIELTVKLAEDGPAQIFLYCEWQAAGDIGVQTGPRKKAAKELKYSVTRTPPRSVARSIPGLQAEPMDLSDREVLARSSMSVQTAYRSQLEKLSAGMPVRELVYGRRRRGKSSIRSSIEKDLRVRELHIVETSAWNATRMISVVSAFEELGGLLHRAFVRGGAHVHEFAFDPNADRDALYRGWRRWLQLASAAAPKPMKVLLLIDEFQKWLGGLDHPQDRQQILDAFRDFNDATLGDTIQISFILFGLRSLKRLCAVSPDFTNAVKQHEIKALTIEEAARYVGQTLPVDHDFRVRNRLARLSGGNPFVLNMLSAELAKLASESQRSYVLGTDVDAMLDQMDSLDSRIDSFFSYMLKEDEDQAAPTLPQLTVLRACASLLHESGDYTTSVRCETVEEWLRARAIPFETGLPATHLSTLADVGVLEVHSDGRRYSLPDEALCRWLASRNSASAPLRPVQRNVDADLVLNRYRRYKLLGSGGQGAEIWEAEDTNLDGRRVALKVYPGVQTDGQGRVRREARLLAKAQGRYVVRFFDHGWDDRHGGVIVMELVEGLTLQRALRELPAGLSPLLPGGAVERQVAMMRKLTEGVMCVHRAGVVHKDLSARNVMLVEEASVWEPKLIDFGISSESSADEGDPLDATSDMGTARYMPPEKIASGARRSREGDIYSLGVLFVDLCAPSAPSTSPRDQLAQSNAKASLKALIFEMLAEDAPTRPSAEVVLARLDGVLVPATWRELRDRAQGRSLAMTILKLSIRIDVPLQNRRLATGRPASMVCSWRIRLTVLPKVRTAWTGGTVCLTHCCSPQLSWPLIRGHALKRPSTRAVALSPARLDYMSY